jgi:hypothetical protein
MRRGEDKEASDQLKAQKVTSDMTNIVDGGADKPKAQAKSRKATQKKSASKYKYIVL